MIHGWFDIELDVAEMGRNMVVVVSPGCHIQA